VIDPKRKLYPRPLLDQFRKLGDDSSQALTLEMVGVGKRVLELGCSNGFMSRLLKGNNCQVTGIEIEPLAAAEARNFCEEVIVADLDTRPLVDLLPGTPFDVAVFGDVLEHLRDPWRVLDEARALLAPGSFVVLSIPNVAHGAVRLALLRGSFDYQPQGLLDATHLRFFTLRSVRELCLRSGYRIEEIRRTKVELFAKSDLLPVLDPNDFSPELIAQVRSDPEHDTLQFVVKAIPLRDEERTSELVTRISVLESELESSDGKTLRLQEELDRFREDAAALAVANSQLNSDLQSARSEAAAEAAELKEEVASLGAALVSSQTVRDHLAADLRFVEARLEPLQSLPSELAKLAAERSDLMAELEIERRRAGERAERLEELETSQRELERLQEEHPLLALALDAESRRTGELSSQLELIGQQLADVRRSAEDDRAALELANRERALVAQSVERLNRAALEQTRAELRRVLEEIAATDAAIQAVYRSRLWALKRAIGAVRPRFPKRQRPN
jgi:2-polyprenyl-3-methyl-5-hydroxy-6-metoxy-1,4-benzoquinol methylase